MRASRVACLAGARSNGDGSPTAEAKASAGAFSIIWHIDFASQGLECF